MKKWSGAGRNSFPIWVLLLYVPVSCPNVAPEVLVSENTRQDKTVYREKAKAFAANFQNNFNQFDDDVPEEVKKIAIQA